MHWVAIGAVATIGLVIVGVIQLRKRGPSLLIAAPPENKSASVLKYRIRSVSGSLPLDLIKPFKPKNWEEAFADLEYATSRIAATIIEVKNDSGGAIHYVRLRLRLLGKLHSVRVESLKHLPKESVRFERAEESVRILIDEMPDNELVVIGLFHEDGYSSRDLRSERANVRLEDADFSRMGF